VDDEYLGFHALYRLYEASDGWVVVCAESQREWENFAELISGEGFAIGEDARFSTASMRRAHDQELIEVVSAIMLTKPAAQWEKCFTDIDVACAQVHPGPPHSAMDEGGLAHRAGMVRTVEHPIFGEHTRTTALVNLSRSEEVLGAGVLNGQNTDEILRELGFDDQRINQLRDHGAVDG
jgi:crotonobetainyl-CoA:carnitine CoA-transferase CaiB-like acyl-CoA transferase